jgi:hypothetical protein
VGLATIFYCLRFVSLSGKLARVISRGKDYAENAIPLQTTQETSHVIAKHCWGVTSLRLRGSMSTKPLPRSGLHNPVLPLLRVGPYVLRTLPSNGFTCLNINCSLSSEIDFFVILNSNP